MPAMVFFALNGLVVGYLLLRLLGVLNPSKPNLEEPEESAAHRISGNESNPSGERLLNCCFTYKGQEYDAFVVLDIPAGADHELCREAFSRWRSLQSDHEFVASLERSLRRYFRH